MPPAPVVDRSPGALFLAVELGAGARARLAASLRSLRHLDPALAVVRPAGVHVTVHFLGSLSPAQAGRVVDAVAPVAAAWPAFCLGLGGLGAFPGWRGPRVLWLGCARGAEPLRDLAAAVTGVLVAAGFPAPAVPYRPHATLARVRGPLTPAARRWLQRPPPGWPAPDPLPVAVGQLTLLQSVAQATGPARYRRLRRLPLR